VISGTARKHVSHEQRCGFIAPLMQSETFQMHGSNKLSTLYYPSANSLSVKKHLLELVMFADTLTDESN